MNVTSLLESVNRMNSETAHILDVLGENESYLFRGLTAEIESIRKSLMEEQRRLDASRAGYNAEYKAACRLLKQACRDDLKRAWKNEKGQICACDGFVGIRLTDPKYDLPLADKQVFDLDSLVDGAAKGITSEEENMPDAAALKTYYKVISAEYKAKCNAKELRYLKDANNGYLPIRYKFESNGAYVNLEYLLLVMEIIPDAKFYTQKSTVSVIYAKGENTEAIVLPVRASETAESTIRANEDSAALRAGTYFSVA